MKADRTEVWRKASRAAIERAVDVLVTLHTAGSVHGEGVEIQERVLGGQRLAFPLARGAELRDWRAPSCARDPLPPPRPGHAVRGAPLCGRNVCGFPGHR